MNIKRHIPNLFTLGNLFCGTMAAMAAVEEYFEAAAGLVVLGIVFDFFDGFLARILKVQGELGKQLDSLADMVTSGVVPGLLMFRFYEQALQNGNVEMTNMTVFLSFTAFLLTLGAGYRLAKFNIDTRQTDSFIGVPTPAMSLFVVSLPLIFEHTDYAWVKEVLQNVYFLAVTSIVLTILMNVNLPLLSLKFKSFGIKENSFKYLLILISVLLIFTFHYLAVPLIIVTYIILSIIQNFTTPKSAV